jgi:hypothetical protein
MNVIFQFCKDPAMLSMFASNLVLSCSTFWSCGFLAIFLQSLPFCGPGLHSWFKDTVQASNASGGEISHTHLDQTSGPPSSLHNGYRLIPKVKWLGLGLNHLFPSSATVKGRVQLYFYCPSVPA